MTAIHGRSRRLLIGSDVRHVGHSCHLHCATLASAMRWRTPVAPSWLTFFANKNDSLWSIDLFRAESITLCRYWVMLVLDVFSRRIVGFNVRLAHEDGIAVCCMFNEARTCPRK
jgi:transposase InsO family protein